MAEQGELRYDTTLPVNQNFNFTFRIDDVLSLNNSRFCDFVDRIYPIELEIKAVQKETLRQKRWFCRSLAVLLYFYFWTLCSLFFFDIRILIAPLVSSNSSFQYLIQKSCKEAKIDTPWGSCYSIFSFICMFCGSLFVFLYFFYWSLCCLFFFDIRILIAPLVSSISS
jgi:hypothetical protein